MRQLSGVIYSERPEAGKIVEKCKEMAVNNKEQSGANMLRICLTSGIYAEIK